MSTQAHNFRSVVAILTTIDRTYMADSIGDSEVRPAYVVIALLLTLSTAFWAVQSLRRSDAGVAKTATDFFERDKRLRDLLTAEKNALGNYEMAIVLLATRKFDHSVREADQAYEAMNKS